MDDYIWIPNHGAIGPPEEHGMWSKDSPTAEKWGGGNIANDNARPVDDYSRRLAERQAVELSDLDSVLDGKGRRGSFLQTFSGRQFWPMDPRVEDVAIEDIAHSLAMQCRYAGHCLQFYCPTPDQRVLTDDLRWVPAGDLKEGDGLLAFDEEPVRIGSLGKRRRRLRHSHVTYTANVKRKTIRLVMSDGSDVVSSSEHPWLVATKNSGNQKWLTAEDIARDISLGRKRHMHRFYTPWSSLRCNESGWLAGVYDGEGYFSTAKRRGTQLGIVQNPGLVLDRIQELLESFGFNQSRLASTGGRASQVMTLQTLGGLPEIVRLLGSVRPLRLLDKFTSRLSSGEFDKQMQSDGNPLEIVAAYDEGEQWVSGLETSSHTYFCEGFGAHNCVAEHSVHIADWLLEHHGPSLALAGLLHDASEAYLCDVPRPVKPYLAGYKDAEARVQRVVHEAFGLPNEIPAVVHEADNRILIDERQQNMAPANYEGGWPNVEPLGGRLQFWSPAFAKAAFLMRFSALTVGASEERREA